jgi:Fe-S-cluster containining protein
MDCFANKDGRCVSLKDNNFGGRDCPFYKSNKEVSRDEIEASCRAYAESHGGENKEA